MTSLTCGKDLEIAGERRCQGAERRLDLDVLAARRLVRAPREELQQTGRPGAPDLGGAGKGVPRTLQHDREMLAVGLADREAAEALSVVAAVAREAPDQALDDVGPDGGVPGVAQLLRGELEIEERALPRLEVGRQLAQPADQVPFQIAGGGEPLPRAVRHAQMQEHGDRGVVRGDAQCLEIGHRLAQPPAGKPAGPAQIVGADPLVGIRPDQAPDEVEKLLAVGSGDRGFAQPFPRGLEVGHLQRGGIDLHPVLLAQKQRRLLEPGDGGLDAGVVGRGVADEVAVELLLDDLAGRGDDLAVAFRSLLQPPQGPQDGRDLPLLQPRARAQHELALGVLAAEEQHAAGGLAIPPGPAGLLHVVLQRTRNVGVDHQPDVRLVDPHAEGVGRGDDPEPAVAETLLHLLFPLRLEAGVEMVRVHSARHEELRDLLGSAARGAVDDGARRSPGDRPSLEERQDVGVLAVLSGLDHLEGEVVAERPAVDQLQLDPEARPEMVEDVAQHARLGRRGQADHRRRRSVAAELPDEAADVAVVRPEIVAPFREAMRLVDDPVSDLALSEDRPDRGVPGLLGRDQQHRRVAEPHAVERLVALRQRQQPVDRHGRGDPVPAQPVDLVRHKRHERRDHHGERTGLVKAGEGRQLVADGLASARRQDAEHVAAGDGGPHDPLLQRPSVLSHGLRTERGEAEPAAEQPGGVVLLAAPCAGRIGAGCVAERAQERARLGERVTHPRRHDRVSAGDGDPRQRVGQRPAAPLGIVEDRGDLVDAGFRARILEIARRAASAVGRGRPRTARKTASKPASSARPAVSQWNAASTSGSRSPSAVSASIWFRRTSSTSRASSSGSLTCPA